MSLFIHVGIDESPWMRINMFYMPTLSLQPLSEIHNTQRVIMEELTLLTLRSWRSLTWKLPPQVNEKHYWHEKFILQGLLWLNSV